MRATVDRLFQKLRRNVGEQCDLRYKVRADDATTVLTIEYALRADGSWQTVKFPIAQLGKTELEQAIAIADIFHALEARIRSVSGSGHRQ